MLVGEKYSINSFRCAIAMDNDLESAFAEALGQGQPRREPQQGMSPKSASAPEGDTLAVLATEVPNYGSANDEAVSVRALAVAVDSPPAVLQAGGSEVAHFGENQAGVVGLCYDHQGDSGMAGSMVGSQTATQAANWGADVFAQRRASLPIWLQRIGSFFQEIRQQQATAPMWMPSPLGSPETPGDAGQHRALFSQDQWARVRTMEQRAPLLFGQSQRRDESSGGSTQEAVQEEVRRQMQGVMGQLQKSQQENEHLKREVMALRAQHVMNTPEPAIRTPVEMSTPPQLPNHLRQAPLPIKDREELPPMAGQPQVFGNYLRDNEGQGAPSARIVATYEWNGIASVYGRSTWNGIASVYGMSTWNGLASVYGMSAWNDIAGVYGMSAWNGVAGVYCVSAWNGISGVYYRSAWYGTPGSYGGFTWKGVFGKFASCGKVGNAAKDTARGWTSVGGGKQVSGSGGCHDKAS